jgi:hypothetical protein
VDDLAAAGLATRVHDDVELACDHLHAVEVLLVLDEASDGSSQELPASHAATAGGRGGDAGRWRRYVAAPCVVVIPIDWVRNPLLRVVHVSLPVVIHPFFLLHSKLASMFLSPDGLSPRHLVGIARVPVHAPANPAMTTTCRSSPYPKNLIYPCGGLILCPHAFF